MCLNHQRIALSRPIVGRVQARESLTRLHDVTHLDQPRDDLAAGAKTHVGLDISSMFGAPVRTPADGLVIFASRQSDYGNLIIIDHGNGITTRLGHLSRFQVKVAF